jgi:hypothetical protein
VTHQQARERLHAAEAELAAAVRDGRSRDAKAWQIAVEVMRHLVETGEQSVPA